VRKKKHAPIEALREAKKFADELLVEKYKIRLPYEKSVVNTIKNTAEAPKLPGGVSGPEYLPYPWTINAARRVLYDLTREWELNVKQQKVHAENITEFFKFVVKGLEEEQGKIKVLIQETVKKKEYNFKYLREKDALEGISKFLIDSFAVSIVVKQNSAVTEYIEFFLHWTDSLLNYWDKTQQKVDAKVVRS
jgi:hypothetical protein